MFIAHHLKTPSSKVKCFLLLAVVILSCSMVIPPVTLSAEYDWRNTMPDLVLKQYLAAPEPQTGEAGWSEAYRVFILDSLYLSSGQRYTTKSDYYSRPIEFALHDIDSNGVPELIIFNGSPDMAGGTNYVYALSASSVAYVGDAGFRESYLYFLDDARYPGVLCSDGNMGYYRTYYYYLKDGVIKEEFVSSEEYTDDFETFTETRHTSDVVLYNASKAKREELQFFSISEIRAMTWDGFVSKAGFTGGINTKPEAPLIVSPTRSSVFIDGTEVAFEAYNIGGNNFFKLRDLAFALNGTIMQFDVGYDAATRAITMTSFTPYTSLGGEMALGDGSPKAATLNSAINISKDGAPVQITAYLIEGNNFMKLRDVMKLIDVSVWYDNATRNINIDTSLPYTD